LNEPYRMIVQHLENNAQQAAVIDWASTYFAHPWDRGWLQAEAPPIPLLSYEVWCRCGREPVTLKRCPCADGQGVLYIGQCRFLSCQAILWAYAPLEAGRPE
jgi:hypothetical protein